MSVESQFITMPVLKEMLAMQKESYQSSLKLVMDGVKTEVKELRREVQGMKESVSFMSGKYDDVKTKFDVTESKIKAAFIQIEGMNKDIMKIWTKSKINRNTLKIIPDGIVLNCWEFQRTMVKIHGMTQS